ncbi:hypothetical protein BaRGS_00008117, partial [Batillaria attramentaria]
PCRMLWWRFRVEPANFLNVTELKCERERKKGGRVEGGRDIREELLSRDDNNHNKAVFKLDWNFVITFTFTTWDHQATDFLTFATLSSPCPPLSLILSLQQNGEGAWFSGDQAWNGSRR